MDIFTLNLSAPRDCRLCERMYSQIKMKSSDTETTINKNCGCLLILKAVLSPKDIVENLVQTFTQ